jgi:hypothetical protein
MLEALMETLDQKAILRTVMQLAASLRPLIGQNENMPNDMKAVLMKKFSAVLCGVNRSRFIKLAKVGKSIYAFLDFKRLYEGCTNRKLRRTVSQLKKSSF